MIMKVKPFAKYIFFHKSFSFQSQSLLSESGKKFSIIKEKRGYHFIGAGISLTPKKEIIGRSICLEVSYLALLDPPHFGFSSQNLELGISSDLNLSKKNEKGIFLYPFISGTIPLEKSQLFSTSMINFGVRLSAFSF
jgi:hypothetical protein